MAKLPFHICCSRARTLALAAAVVAAALLAPAAVAPASPSQFTIMQDDPQMVYGKPHQRNRDLDELKRLGASYVKVRMSWRNIAPPGRHRPRHFDATNPAAYPAQSWAPFDAVVAGAAARGMGVFVELGGDSPQWAVKGRGRKGPNEEPSAGEFGKFVEAVGRRYSGTYSPSLPRVTLWSVWNEPNLAPWLTPQYRGSMPVAPILYRSLIYSAYDGLAKSGHANDRLLIGELMPFARSGTAGIKVRPLDFLRELACVDSHYRPFSGQAAKERHCDHFKRLPGTGLAYHPYTLAGGPNIPTPNPSDASIGNLGRVSATLDALSGRGRMQARRLDIWITEFGFQTDPPDPYETPIKEVPGFLGESEWLAFRNPRVVSWDQYPLVDDPTSRHSEFSGFHSGIRFHDFHAKPGVYHAFELPFYVRSEGSRVELFGGVRAARGSGGTVTIESRIGGRGHFKHIAPVPLDPAGYFDIRLRSSSSREYRFIWGRVASRSTGPS